MDKVNIKTIEDEYDDVVVHYMTKCMVLEQEVNDLKSQIKELTEKLKDATHE